MLGQEALAVRLDRTNSRPATTLPATLEDHLVDSSAVPVLAVRFETPHKRIFGVYHPLQDFQHWGVPRGFVSMSASSGLFPEALVPWKPFICFRTFGTYTARAIWSKSSFCLNWNIRIRPNEALLRTASAVQVPYSGRWGLNSRGCSKILALPAK